MSGMRCAHWHKTCKILPKFRHMNRSFPPFIFLSAFALLAGSCKKLKDYYNPEDKSNCKIASITQAAPNNLARLRDGFFEYNSSGDLARVAFNGRDLGQSENTDWLFSYDANRRIVRIDRKQNPDQIFERSSYITYTWRNNRITNQYLNGRGFDYEQRIFDSIVYDNQGRVAIDYVFTQVLSSSPVPYERRDTIRYNYNSQGNLILPGQTASYTNRKSFLRTDPLLMFLFRNYSRNEAIAAKGYTAEGWPTGFPADRNKPLPVPFFESPYITNITYNCASTGSAAK